MNIEILTLNKANVPYLTEISYTMPVSSKFSYLLVRIILLSQDRFIKISTVNFKMTNIAFIIQGSIEGQSNWNMD